MASVTGNDAIGAGAKGFAQCHGSVSVLGILLASFSTLMFGAREQVTKRVVSPDGRWEARLVEHPGIAYCVDEIVLAPRGFATFDPTAYPTRPLGETTMEGELDHFFWPDPSTLVLFLRPQTELPPVLTPNPAVRVKVVNLKPPPSSVPERS